MMIGPALLQQVANRDLARLRVGGADRRHAEGLGAGSLADGVCIALDFAWMRIARRGLDGFDEAASADAIATEADALSVELDPARRATAQLLSGGDLRVGVRIALGYTRHAVECFGMVSVKASAQRRAAELVAAAAPPLSFRCIARRAA